MEVVKKSVKKFESIIVIALLGMMVLVVFLSTIELAVILVEQLLSPPLLLLEIDELLKIFGFFLMILIGLELVETLKVYISEEIVHVEFVFLVAIIAVSRKVIVLDIKNLDPLTLIGLASIILALSGGFYLLKKTLGINQKQLPSDK
jgi:uncharacterized membrane protein (DUF373 family)